MSGYKEPNNPVEDMLGEVGTDADLATFYRVYPGAIPVMRADRSALGTIPAKAYQYCEALCSASAFGWYVFPASDIRLMFDGSDVFVECEGEWQLLSSMHLPGVDQWWDNQCPIELEGMAPPFLTSLGVPGYVQIWSGMLARTRQDWSLLVRPLVNVDQTRQFQCFEGIVETDQYAPAPLFTNIKIRQTDTVIEIPADKPLFQIQPVRQDSYKSRNLNAFSEHLLFDTESGDSVFSEADWVGYASTVRAARPTEDMHALGSYGARTRKRSKQNPDG